jgi:hypothetical protein
MLSNLRSILTSLLVVLLLLQGASPLVGAQATAGPTPAQLDQLLAPVALYPDALLSQITTASTTPQEILDVNAWLQANPGLTGTTLTDAAEKQGFDPAFISLVYFPTVVAMMADHIDDYASVGQAFSTDQDAVTASIQRLRAQAYKSGALRTSEQQKVEVEQAAGQTIYVIQPASPTAVYVPQYDPTVVYVRPAPGAIVAPSPITFSVGIGVGALMVDNRPWGWGGWGWNWGARRAYYNHGYWNGWGNPYRPPHYWYHPRPIVWANRPGYGGNWGYRPPHYRPPNYRPPSAPAPRPGRPGNPPLGHHPVPGKPTPGKPAPGSPTPGKPGTPARPGSPSPGKPTPGPGQPSKPSTPNQPRPGQPSTPGGNKPTRPDQPSGQPGRPQQPGPNQPDSNQPKPTRPAGPGGKQPARPTQPSGRPGKPGAPEQPKSGQPKPTPPAPGQGNTAARRALAASKPDSPTLVRKSGAALWSAPDCILRAAHPRLAVRLIFRRLDLSVSVGCCDSRKWYLTHLSQQYRKNSLSSDAPPVEETA